MIILFFFIIGVTTLFIEKPKQVIIPALVFGTIYFFVKHPEKLRNFNTKSNYKQPPTKIKKTVKRKKDNPFTVIEGKNREDKQKYE